MSNAEAVEELARAVDHIDRAEQLADSAVSKKEIEQAERQCYDAIDGLVNDMVQHPCRE